MKFFFFLFSCNIIFFLWEFNSRPINTLAISHENGAKQIVLLSELPKKQAEVIKPVAKQKPKVKTPKKIAAPIELINIEIKFPLETFNNSLKLETQDDVLFGIEGLNSFKTLFKNIELNESIEPLTTHFNDLKITKNKESEESNIDKKVSEMEQTEYCYQAGPFLDEKKLAEWIKLNKIEKKRVTHFNQQKKTISNYLVYYPAAKTYELSKKNIKIIKSKGVSNFWLFGKGELKGVISLGMFAKEKRALLLQKKLAKVKLKTQIMPRYKIEYLWYAKILSKNKGFNKTITLSEKQALSVCGNI